MRLTGFFRFLATITATASAVGCSSPASAVACCHTPRTSAGSRPASSRATRSLLGIDTPLSMSVWHDLALVMSWSARLSVSPSSSLHHWPQVADLSRHSSSAFISSRARPVSANATRPRLAVAVSVSSRLSRSVSSACRPENAAAIASMMPIEKVPLSQLNRPLVSVGFCTWPLAGHGRILVLVWNARHSLPIGCD